MPEARSTAPGLAVAGELVRALGNLALAPAHAVGFALTRGRRLEEVARDLAAEPPPIDEPPRTSAPRDLRVFVSCAEVSGEIHAVNLVRALREQAGPVRLELAGLGGQRLAAEGVDLVGEPVARSAMGFGVVTALPYYLGLLRDAARELRAERPDVVVAVDSPALHVPLGHLARRYGVPVVHFVTPQYWGWAPWRTRGYRKAVDLGLSILPFEPAWFARRGVRCRHVGHPLVDELARVPAPARRATRDRLVLLGGSRRSVLERNLPWMLACAETFRERHPDAEVVVANARTELEPELRAHIAATGAEEWATLELGDLHASLDGARAALSVSGTILLDLLHHRLPTVVLYRLTSRLEAWLSGHVLTVPSFASPNLLAGWEVMPEFCFAGDGPRAEVLAALDRLWLEGPARETARGGLEAAVRRLGGPGAVARAAGWVRAVAEGRGIR